MTKMSDPTEPIRRKASEYAGVDEGTACTQSSFKVGKKAFLFIGEQGGRYKAMFKLERSLQAARALSEEQPKDFQVGNTNWVTARFSTERPLPKKIWSKWLDESYQLSAGQLSSPKGTTKKPPARKKLASQPKVSAKSAKRPPRKSK